MTFKDFQQVREQILRERPGVLDCAQTNLYRTLARVIPPAAPACDRTEHRCHLAESWVEYFGFPPETARRALVSCGVRHSLALLFQHYATQGAQLWLPEDNYPVYGELARAAGLAPRTFPTMPEPRWPAAAAGITPELLVVTNPLKPLGRWLDAEDVSALTVWLTASPRRRLLLDTVYTFETRFHASTLELWSTAQTLLLHSLTKGWLSPRIFGVALVPEHDAGALTPVFREQPPGQANLSRARELLCGHPGLPATVARELASARQRLLSVLPDQCSSVTRVDGHGYFHAVAGNWSDLLETTNLLGLPATVFGSAQEEITILSSLNFVP
jgi:hypothetical protein